ncbi:hypothetical protein [Thermogemmatispora sp.]|uniref:hypothetical protein n=1 Tax=Thermogemmatispora sp. TaxID=1968838 RepID=UPI001D230C49|nr:hypothetical protein [Thermogemmatispora sp.]MBX5448760.1 hypothetical protein [Thermogemmatispora sp.]
MSSSPPPLEETLLPLAEALEALGIRYVIDGSVASSLSGVVRQTADLDVVIELLDPSSSKPSSRKSLLATILTKMLFGRRFALKEAGLQ